MVGWNELLVVLLMDGDDGLFRSLLTHLSPSLVLSLAYETLSNPSSKLMYDLSSKPAQPGTGLDDENPNETLQRVLHQVKKTKIQSYMNSYSNMLS